MVIKDNRGQVSLEYILIFTISLIFLIVFTFPLVETTIGDTVDVSDSLKMKSDLSKLSQAVNQVYGEGQGSKQTVNILSSKSITVSISSSQASSSLKLHDGSTKIIKVTYNSNLGKSSLTLKKGQNTLIVEWPTGSKNMKIYKK